jgi:2-polyprenyl-3-methyl-5-hydroxy-6-metoxy-1,4-benzoquinol methylase
MDKKVKLIDIGSQDNRLKEVLPSNVEYKSLDMVGDVDYKHDLNKKRIPIKDKTFDVTVCLETLEHVFYPHKVMEELIRITKDDGFLIISMPNEHNFWQRLKFLFGFNNATDEPFEMIEKNLHIHRPRANDIINFSKEHMEVINIIPIWQSRMSSVSNLFYFFDKMIRPLAKIYPNLFARLVVVIGKKKEVK